MKQPNILFIFPDQHRGDWMPYSDSVKAQLGVEGLELTMPNIKKMMERGTTFTRAITPCPLCAPARACLAAASRYRNCRVMDNTVNYDPTLRTVYNVLNDAGYSVGGVGKFDLNKADYIWGENGDRPELHQMGFTHALDSEGKGDGINAAEHKKMPGPYLKFLMKNGLDKLYIKDMRNRMHADRATELGDEFYCDNWIANNGVKMISEFPKDKPWFLQVNYAGPHSPWDVTKSMKEAYKDKKFPMPAEYSLEHNINGVRQNYAAMLENIDRNIEVLMQEVRNRGEEDNTIIVYSSDHGEMLGDHNMFYKTKPWQGSVSVPLVIDDSCINGKRGIVNNTPVELQDLAATFAEYAGVKLNMRNESRSLKPIIDGKCDKVRSYAMSELIMKNKCDSLPAAWRIITDGRYKLIMESNMQDRLFDLSNDPFECNDIACNNKDKIASLKKMYLDDVGLNGKSSKI